MENIVLCIVGSALTVLWFALFCSGKGKYQSVAAELDGKEYFLREIFPVGYRTMDLLQVDASSSGFQKKLRSLGEIYDAKTSQKLALADMAAEISYVLSFMPIGVLTAAIVGDVSILLIVLALAAVLVFYIEYDRNTKANKRHEKIMQEFPHMLSQMALLMNAGMPLREALEVASKREEGILCQEMKAMMGNIRSGMPEYEALSLLADRCGVDCVRKFSNLVIQNVKKGSTELAGALMELSEEIWRTRVNAVKVEGEKASTRLLVPIIMIFIGILLMVMLPMMRGMSI